MFRADFVSALGAFALVSDSCCVPFERFRFIHLSPLPGIHIFCSVFLPLLFRSILFAAFIQVCFFYLPFRLKFRIIAHPLTFLICNSLYFNSFSFEIRCPTLFKFFKSIVNRYINSVSVVLPLQVLQCCGCRLCAFHFSIFGNLAVCTATFFYFSAFWSFK